MAHQPPASDDRPIISHSSILILSGYLIGVAVGRAHPDLLSDSMTCGIAGLLAFLALDRVAERRARHQSEKRQVQAEARLARHLRKSGAVARWRQKQM